MESAGLAGFAEIGIIIFMVSFAMILLNAFFGMSDRDEDEALHMPLDGGEVGSGDEPTTA